MGSYGVGTIPNGKSSMWCRRGRGMSQKLQLQAYIAVIGEMTVGIV